MFPIRDTIPSRGLPVVNWLIITCNVIVFLFEASLAPEQQNRLIHILGMIPRQLVHRPVPEVLTILTSMFLHGGWFHLISNMWALYIFGDNVEDRIGHFRYLGFYLLCGAIAAGVQVLSAINSTFPMVGASGAIAGILGAYLISFPRARVLTLIPIFFFPWFIEIPALFYLGLWFLSQLFNGLFALAMVDSIGIYGGVAWWAHIGGFVAGLILVKRFERRRIHYDW